MVRSFRRPDIVTWRGGRPEIVLVPTRVDISELDSRDRFEARFRMVEPQFLPELFSQVNRSFWDLQIPYVPKLAYEEALIFSSPGSRARVVEVKELARAYRNLAGSLAALAPEGSRIQDPAGRGGLDQRLHDYSQKRPSRPEDNRPGSSSPARPPTLRSLAVSVSC